MKAATPNFRLAFLVIAITVTLVTTHPVFSGSLPVISITESSSISLSAMYNGSTFTGVNTGPDQWTLTFPTTVTFISNLDVGWIEPENPSQVNLITSAAATPHQLFVTSDITPNLTSVFQDGFLTTFSIATDNSNPVAPVSVFASFRDLAAAGETRIPDTGTTGSLLGLSLMGLAFLRRKLY